jgi:hypothetical protein
MNYFLITAMPKSGTTWVQRICRAHPEMHCRAEDQFTKFWARVKELTRDYNDLVELRDQQRDKQGVEPFDQHDGVKLFYSMVQIAMDKAPADVAWSGVKDLTLSARGFLTYLPNARVINVIRDPRDTAISALAHSRRIYEGNKKDLSELNDAFVSETARHWLKQIDLGDAVRGEFPNRTYDIRYEDLIGDFSSAAQGLMNFFGVDSTPATIEALRLDTDFQRLSGGRAPGKVDDSSYFRSGVAGDWRGTLSETQVSLVDGICGATLSARGYDRR